MLMRKNLLNLIFTHLVSNIISIILLLVIIILLFSGRTGVMDGKGKIDGGETDVYSVLWEDLSQFKELKSYEEEKPRITFLSDDIAANLKVSDPDFFGKAQEGNLILEFSNKTVLYDPINNTIVNMLDFDVIPSDFFEKLVAHQEISGYTDQTPQVIKINDITLPGLQQQIPQLNQNYLGKYMLIFDDKIFIYDYLKDVISLVIDKSELQPNPQSGIQAAQQLPQTSQQTLPQSQPQQLLLDQNVPLDLLQKLLTHNEMSGLETTTPVGGRITQESYVQLQTFQPQIAEIALIGDFLIQYPDRLIIFNYENDEIKNTIYFD
ncbi:MAG: hypothetical protein ABII01_00890 [Candidatus Woesearchaeota archaeon]